MRMWKSDERGFLALGIGLPLWTAAFLCLGGCFLSYMHMVLMEKADLELSQEIHTAMQMMLTDAAEAQGIKLTGYGGEPVLRFHKAERDFSGWTDVTYLVRKRDGRQRLYRGHMDPQGFQPLTGDNLLGRVEIDTFEPTILASGAVHVRLGGRSVRTGHRVEQTAEFPRQVIR